MPAAPPTSPTRSPRLTAERSEAEEAAAAAADLEAADTSYDALLAGSYDQYVRNQAGAAPNWAAPERVEQVRRCW